MYGMYIITFHLTFFLIFYMASVLTFFLASILTFFQVFYLESETYSIRLYIWYLYILDTITQIIVYGYIYSEFILKEIFMYV